MIEQFLKYIKEAKRIAIFTHRNPDGDALGSALAMYEFLTINFPNIKKSVYTDFTNLGEEYLTVCGDIILNPPIERFDLAICLDTSSKDMLGCYQLEFEKIKKSIVIDHHKTNTNFCEMNIIDLLSSNCEHLYNLLKSTGLKINDKICNYICVGITTDTNALSNNNVDASTYLTMAELINNGAKAHQIRQLFFSGYNKNKYQFIAYAMSKAEFLLEDKIMIVNLTKEDFLKFNINEDDTVGVINQLFKMKEAYACFMISPRKERLHISMRSIETLDVSKLAQSFGGGGHLNASACDTDLSYEEIKDKILSEFAPRLKSFKPTKFSF